MNFRAGLLWLVGLLLFVGTGVAMQARATSMASAQEPDVVNAGANPRPTSSPIGTLQFVDDAYIGGTLVPCQIPGHIQWQNTSFAEPFLFPLPYTSSIAFPSDAVPVPEKGSLGFELNNGDQIYGQLVSIDGPEFRVDTDQLGSVVVQFTDLRRIFRWNDGASGTFIGPGPLHHWDARGNEAAWSDRGGQLKTSVPAAEIRRNIGLGNRSRVEIELSWTGTPNFNIALGTDLTDETANEAFRIEVWDSAFVLLRELDDMAEVVSIGATHEAKGQLRLAIDLDQTNNHAIVYSDTGAKLADLKLGSESSVPLPGFHLTNLNGNIRLDSLRVFNSGGPLTEISRKDVPLAHLDSGSLAEHTAESSQAILGQWTAIQNGRVVVKDGDTETLLPLDQLIVALWPLKVASVDAAPDTSETDTPLATENSASSGTTRIVTQGTSRITGDIQSVSESQVTLAPALIKTEIQVPLTAIRGIQNLGDVKQVTPSGRRGTLELADSRLLGVLLEGQSSADATCLNFAPVAANNSARLLHSANGSLVYRIPDPPKTSTDEAAAAQPPPRQRGMVGAMFGAFVGGSRGAPARRLIHLRNGDIVTGQVSRVDENGVLLQSDVAGDQLIPNREIKALEINGNAGVPSLEQAKKLRLLTVPRMRKKSPPQHLLVSTQGDFLRGNLVSMDAETIVVENRLEIISVLRRNVSKIIFFHADELETTEDPQSSPDKVAEDEASTKSPPAETDENVATQLKVQAIQRDGTRLTFFPKEVGGNELVGDSPLLGVCLVDLKTADAILFGAQIQASTADLPYHQWKLSHAPEPNILTGEGNEDGRAPGTSSPLVGTDAPDFKLKMLDGSIFQLQNHQGKIIVLDFWATWCGPCIQAMPQIDEAVNYFSPDDVMLVAVNLQESPEDIRATLDRLNLNPAVALDIDGVAASKYQAESIPQTVIIDRSGKIHRLFVGGGPKLKEQLQTAIADLIEPPAEQKFPETSSE